MKRLAIMLVLVCAAPIVRAGSPEEDWKAVVALDAGPPGEPKTQDEARERALGHLEKQERALRAFLVGHAEDERAFEARLRLSRALQIRADFTGDEKLRADAMKLLVELDRTATPAQRAEVDFAKITALMRTLRQPTREQREELLAEARKFQGDHPGDRRLASLLAEVAALFDMQPATKLALLEDALPLAKDAELKSRIADDLKRVRLFGKTLPLAGPTLQGRKAGVEQLRGKPVLILFFADFSPPSTAALASIQRAVADLGAGSVQVLCVSLDGKRDTVAALLREMNVTWPVIFDGKGWESPLIRELGINELPTVWLLDAKGRLRSLNALEGTAAQVRQLLKE